MRRFETATGRRPVGVRLAFVAAVWLTTATVFAAQWARGADLPLAFLVSHALTGIGIAYMSYYLACGRARASVDRARVRLCVCPWWPGRAFDAAIDDVVRFEAMHEDSSLSHEADVWRVYATTRDGAKHRAGPSFARRDQAERLARALTRAMRDVRESDPATLAGAAA